MVTDAFDGTTPGPHSPEVLSFEYERNVLGQLSKFIDMLPKHLETERILHEFEFLPLSEDTYVYPDTLKDWFMTRTLEGVRVTIVKEGVLPDMTSIELTSSAGLMHISRDALRTEAPHSVSPDWIFNTDGTEQQIPHIPDNQVRALLLSLGNMRPEAELAALDESDQSAVESSQLFDRLSENAITQTSHHAFELPSGRKAHITYSKDAMTSFSLIYETASDKRVDVEIDAREGLTIHFRILTDSGVAALFPDQGDYMRLGDVLAEEIATLGDASDEISVSPAVIHSLDFPDANNPLD